MGRAPCCDKANVKRGPWSPEEDATLKSYVQTHGTAGNWIALPRKAGLRRCGKSCRLRWLNYLRPDIKHGGFTEEEDKIIFTLYGQMGSRWSAIASQLPGRTDNDVKNYWNTKLKKKVIAGKVNLKMLTNNNDILHDSTPSLTQNSNFQNQDSPVSQNQNSPTSIIANNSISGFNNNEKNVSFHQTFHQLYYPTVINDVSEIGSSSTTTSISWNHKNAMVSLSQECSSISDSSSIAINSNKFGDESNEILMDFGFGFSYDHHHLVNNGVNNCHDEKVGELLFSPSCYNPEWLDFITYADIKPN